MPTNSTDQTFAGRDAQSPGSNSQTPLGLSDRLRLMASIRHQFHLADTHQPCLAILDPQPGNLGFDTFQTNLLTVPAWVLFLIQLLFWSWMSEKINNRMAIAEVYSAWCFAGLMAFELMPDSSSPWAWYAVTVLMIGFPYIHSIMASLTSRNAGSVRTRTLGSAMYNMICQASSVIASNVSPKSKDPDAGYGHTELTTDLFSDLPRR